VAVHAGKDLRRRRGSKVNAVIATQLQPKTSP
jgi:hypothetical protein